MENSRENAAVRIHRKVVMARRVREITVGIASLLPEGVTSVLDVGAGSGEMALELNKIRPELKISGVDVYVRPKTFIPVTAYDGEKLPFEENAIDAVMIVDVIHHCNDPLVMLRECARVSSKWVVVKDHVSDSMVDKWTLMFMDWVGNKAHGVTLPFNYLSSPEWSTALNHAGLRDVKGIDRLDLYPFPFNHIFGRRLHCLHLLSKVSY